VTSTIITVAKKSVFGKTSLILFEILLQTSYYYFFVITFFMFFCFFVFVFLDNVFCIHIFELITFIPKSY